MLDYLVFVIKFCKTTFSEGDYQKVLEWGWWTLLLYVFRYAAKILEIDVTDLSVFIHFDRWSSKFDEWIDMRSDRLRAASTRDALPGLKQTTPLVIAYYCSVYFMYYVALGRLICGGYILSLSFILYIYSSLDKTWK